MPREFTEGNKINKKGVKMEYDTMESFREKIEILYPKGAVFEATKVIPYADWCIHPGALGVVQGTSDFSIRLSFDFGNHCTREMPMTYETMVEAFKKREKENELD